MGKNLHVRTPLIENTPLSKLMGAKVMLKMDNVQPSGSFKIRGVGHMCQVEAERGAKKFISSSGGNAGIACAYAGRQLGVPVIVVVPETTSMMMVEMIRAEDAEVIIHGQAWDDANDLALKMVSEDKFAVYIPPFDNELIWEGNSTLIDEIVEDIQEPDLIVTVVGGGGLLSGLCIGLDRAKWSKVPILVAETLGADSYNASVKAGKLVTLDKITSSARTLGARKVCEKSFEFSKTRAITSVVLTDDQALSACKKFALDQRILVETSCGVGLATLYEKIPEISSLLTGKSNPVIVVIICGGNAIPFSDLK